MIYCIVIHLLSHGASLFTVSAQRIKTVMLFHDEGGVTYCSLSLVSQHPAGEKQRPFIWTVLDHNQFHKC